MHSLALHLGRPVDELARSITEAELRRWMRYAGRHGLPLQRIELMLAQLSMVIARSMGSKKARTADFLLKAQEELPPNVTRIEAARMAFGFNPRKKKA